jgi:aspartokinase-like uncharacterized kinase
MRIIKLGGSLAHAGTLRDSLQRIAAYNMPVVIVPGGGLFAESVREAQQYWQFDDGTAHEMAVLAMQQMALLMRGLQNDFLIARSNAAIRSALIREKTVIWSPDITELNAAGIAASWDVSADSLAAWLAGELSADELYLVKAASIVADMRLSALAEYGIIDAAFCDFTARLPAHCQIRVLNVAQL